MFMKHHFTLRINCFFLFALVILVAGCTNKSTSETLNTPKYAIVFDAGSSKTRASVYQIVRQTPLKITPLLDESMKIPLAKFSDNPEQAGQTLIQPLLDKVKKFLWEEHNSVPSEAIVSVLGTAGMRKIPVLAQTKIYKDISATVNKNGFLLGEFKTITGEQEGLYAWANINYINGAFDKGITSGIVEIGGASAQVAFETDEVSHPNITTVSINKKNYNVYSASFLGLGANDIINTMRKKSESSSCYPNGYNAENIRGQFSFPSCERLFDELLLGSNFNKLKEISSIKKFQNQDFFGVSGLYHTLNFFDDKTPTHKQLMENTEAICRKGYDELKTYGEGKDQHNIFNKCASATFVDSFLFNVLKIKDQKLKAVKNIKGTDLRWTLGYVLLSSSSYP